MDLFQALESRILLSTVLNVHWTGGAADGNKWSTTENWAIDGSNASLSAAPDNTADTLYNVTIDRSARIEMDESPSISNLTISGNAAVTLDLGNNNSNTGGRHITVVGGTIYLNQTVGTVTSLTLMDDAAGSISANGFAVEGDRTGSSALNVGTNVTMNLAGNLQASHYALNATVNGRINAANAYFTGQDNIAGATWSPSIINISNGGYLDVTSKGTLRVGGYGPVTFTVDLGSVDTGNLEIYDDTTTNLQDTITGAGEIIFVPPSGSHVHVYGNLTVGSAPTGSIFTPSAAIDSASGSGAKLNILNNSLLQVLGAQSQIQGGDGIVVNDTGSAVMVKNLLVGPGNANKAGPVVNVTVALGVGQLIVDGNANIGGGYYENNLLFLNPHNSGQLVVQSSAVATITKHLSVISYKPELAPILDVQLTGTLNAQTAGFGESLSTFIGIPTTIAVTTVDIDGTLKVTGSGYAACQAGFSFGVTKVNGNGTMNMTSGGSLLKMPAAYVAKSMTIVGKVYGGGVGADFVPGDAAVVGDDGTISVDEDAADPFGVIAIDGDLDASQGMTLDEVFGEGSGESGDGTSQNSMLSVTGNVTLGTESELRIGLANGEDPTTYQADYQAGDAFTLLTAANITGQFCNLADGTSLDSGFLPKLNEGLEWNVTYGATAVTATVVAMPTFAVIDRWVGDPLNHGNGNYFAGTNWSLGVAPGAEDVAEFDGAGYTYIEADSPVNVGEIVVRSGSVSIGSDNGLDIVVEGDIVIDTSNAAIRGSLSLGDSSSPNAISVTCADALIENGELYLGSTGRLTINDDLEIGYEGSVGSGPYGNATVTAIGASVLGQLALAGWTSGNNTHLGSGTLTLTGQMTVGYTEIGVNTAIVIPSVSALYDVQFVTGSTDIYSTTGPVLVNGGSWTVNGTLRTIGASVGVSNGTLHADSITLYRGLAVGSNGTCYANSIVESGDDSFIWLYNGGQLVGPIDHFDGTFKGNLSLSSSASSSVDLNGALPSLNVTGSAVLGGTLNVYDGADALDDLIPGQSFTLFAASNGLSGGFSSIEGLPQLLSGLSWEIIYTANSVIAEVSPDAVYAATSGNVTLSVDAGNGTLDIADGTQTSQIPLSGLNSFTINAGTGDTTIVVDQSQGSLTLAGGLNVQGTGNVTLNISGGAMTFSMNAVGGASALTIEASNGAALTFDGLEYLAGLILDSGTSASLGAGSGTFLLAANLTIASDAKMDIDQGTIVVSALLSTDDVARYVADLSIGRDDGAWDGLTGITSSAAAASNVIAGREEYSVGYRQIWAGGPLLMQVCLSGDANLDGVVDLNDMNIIFNNLGTLGATWSQGDLDYAPTVDLNSLNYVLNELGLTAWA